MIVNGKSIAKSGYETVERHSLQTSRQSKRVMMKSIERMLKMMWLGNSTMEFSKNVYHVLFHLLCSFFAIGAHFFKF